MSIDNALIQRAILMLRIAGTHSQQYGSQDTSFYDGTDCDGSCIEVDCHSTADELERLSKKVPEQPDDYTALGDNDYHRIIKVMKTHLKPCIYYATNDPKPLPKIPEIDFCTAAGIILRGMSPKRESGDLARLQHEYDSTRGLWCIDQDPKEVTHDWIKQNAFQLE